MFVRALGRRLVAPIALSIARLRGGASASPPGPELLPPTDVTAEYVPVFAPQNVHAEEV